MEDIFKKVIQAKNLGELLSAIFERPIDDNEVTKFRQQLAKELKVPPQNINATLVRELWLIEQDPEAQRQRESLEHFYFGESETESKFTSRSPERGVD